MSATKVVRLEYDDGTGVDFVDPADALFHVAYGRSGGGMRGVTGLRAINRLDAEEVVLDGDPALNHPEDEVGEIIWDRDKLEELVAGAHAADTTPPVEGRSPSGENTVLDDTTIDALRSDVVEVDEIAARAANGDA